MRPAEPVQHGDSSGGDLPLKLGRGSFCGIMTHPMLRRTTAPRRAHRCALTIAAALWSASATGLAQSDPDELARRHFDSGAAYFEQAEYEAALREFEKAHELSARPEILLNIATIHERMGNLEQAVVALDRYLAARPEGSDTIRIRRNNIHKRLEQQRAEEAAKLEPKPAPPPEPTPEPAPPVAAAEPAPHSADTGAGGSKLGPYILMGTAGATTIAAIVTGLVAQSQYDSLNADPCATTRTCDTSGAKGLAITSTVLTGVAIAAGIAGVTWFFLAPDEAESASMRPHVDVYAAPSSAFASARWRF